MKKCSFTLNKYIFHLPRRRMDPTSIFVNDLPTHLTYGQIKAAFWPYQQDAPLQVLKKEKYLIITFSKEETMHKVLAEKESIRLKGKTVTIKQATKKFVPTFVHIPPSFHLPPSTLFPLPTPPPPPPCLLVPPFFIPIGPAPQPPAPTATAPAPPPPAPYKHPFPEGFSYFYYKKFTSFHVCFASFFNSFN